MRCLLLRFKKKKASPATTSTTPRATPTPNPIFVPDEEELDKLVGVVVDAEDVLVDVVEEDPVELGEDVEEDEDEGEDEVVVEVEGVNVNLLVPRLVLIGGKLVTAAVINDDAVEAIILPLASRKVPRPA